MSVEDLVVEVESVRRCNRILEAENRELIAERDALRQRVTELEQQLAAANACMDPCVWTEPPPNYRRQRVRVTSSPEGRMR